MTPDEQKLAEARESGNMLLDAILALAVLFSLTGVVASYLHDENQRQERELLASEGAMMLAATRNFVSQNYDDIRLDLMTEANASGTALRSYDMDDLILAGYIPGSFIGSGVMERIHGQRYALMVRAVDRQDGGAPQATLGPARIDPGGTGSIDPTLTDGDATNGEMDIEAVLVTHGGTAIKRGRGGEIVAKIGSAFAGFVTVADATSGAYGNFALDISSYAPLATYPEPGRFASIVAMSRFGVFDGDGGKATAILDPLRRCYGLDISSVAYGDCLNNNAVYTDIVMSPFDGNGDGSVDRFPAIRGLTAVNCAPTGADGVPDAFLIDCATTRLTGNLAVDGDDIDLGALAIRGTDITLDGEALAGRADLGDGDETVLTPDRVVVGAIGDHDLSETIQMSTVVKAGETIVKPVCPERTADGANLMRPRIYVTPAAWSDVAGRPVVGVRAFGEDDADPASWRIRMMIAVNADVCSNDFSSPAAEGSICPGPPDGRSDVYEVGPLYGAAIVQTRCW